jgi:hypothetical protein
MASSRTNTAPDQAFVTLSAPTALRTGFGSAVAAGPYSWTDQLDIQTDGSLLVVGVLYNGFVLAASVPAAC